MRQDEQPAEISESSRPLPYVERVYRQSTRLYDMLAEQFPDVLVSRSALLASGKGFPNYSLDSHPNNPWTIVQFKLRSHGERYDQSPHSPDIPVYTSPAIQPEAELIITSGGINPKMAPTRVLVTGKSKWKNRSWCMYELDTAKGEYFLLNRGRTPDTLQAFERENPSPPDQHAEMYISTTSVVQDELPIAFN
jgi:hypothetical protein